MHRTSRGRTVTANVAVLGYKASSFVAAFDKSRIFVMRLLFENKADAIKRAACCWLTSIASKSA
jgi:hypothetical protein